MKNSIIIFALLGCAASAVWFTLSHSEKTARDCNDIEITAPSFAREVSPDTAYVFNTHNYSSRKFLMILAKKDSTGKLISFKCVEVKQGECKPLPYHPLKKEIVYITYKYHNLWGTTYKTIANVHEGKVYNCDHVEGQKSLPTRKGIVGDTGGSGTASTTVDDK